MSKKLSAKLKTINKLINHKISRKSAYNLILHQKSLHYFQLINGTLLLHKNKKNSISENEIKLLITQITIN